MYKLTCNTEKDYKTIKRVLAVMEVPYCQIKRDKTLQIPEADYEYVRYLLSEMPSIPVAVSHSNTPERPTGLIAQIKIQDVYTELENGNSFMFRKSVKTTPKPVSEPTDYTRDKENIELEEL